MQGSINTRFSPGWLHEQFGTVFGESFAFDVPYRTRMIMECERLVHERFGRLGLGSRNPQPVLDLRWVYKNVVCVMYGGILRRGGKDDGWIQPFELGKTLAV